MLRATITRPVDLFLLQHYQHNEFIGSWLRLKTELMRSISRTAGQIRLQQTRFGRVLRMRIEMVLAYTSP